MGITHSVPNVPNVMLVIGHKLNTTSKIWNGRKTLIVEIKWIYNGDIVEIFHQGIYSTSEVRSLPLKCPKVNCQLVVEFGDKKANLFFLQSNKTFRCM